MRCTECDRSRSKRVSQRIYLCALCGEPRCELHATWVPAHMIDDAIESASQIQTMLINKPVEGWYAFCGQTGHIPRGVSIRFGKERTGVPGLCLSELYSGMHASIKWKCGKCGYQWLSTPDSVKYQRNWCKKCAGIIKLENKTDTFFSNIC